jgi:hypothetical protein
MKKPAHGGFFKAWCERLVPGFHFIGDLIATALVFTQFGVIAVFCVLIDCVSLSARRLRRLAQGAPDARIGSSAGRLDGAGRWRRVVVGRLQHFFTDDFIVIAVRVRVGWMGGKGLLACQLDISVDRHGGSWLDQPMIANMQE